MRKKEWKLLSCSKRGAEENSNQRLGGAFSEPGPACGLNSGKVESPTTGARLSDISGTGSTAMTFFGLSFTVFSASSRSRTTTVIQLTQLCEVGSKPIPMAGITRSCCLGRR